MRFDAMHAVTGPYAKEILETPARRAGRHRDQLPSRCRISAAITPTPTWCTPSTLRRDVGPDAPDFGAASDGDGDRNMIIGRGIFVTPSDQLAMLAANAHLVPGYSDGLGGVARSMPTSRAADRVAGRSASACYETPTGWKFFGNLLDAGRPRSAARRAPAPAPTMCARRTGCGRCCSGSTSSRPAARAPRRSRAGTGRLRPQLLLPPRLRGGRRRSRQRAHGRACAASCRRCRARAVGDLKIAAADDFAYDDPVDGSVSRHQGIRVIFEGGSRVVFRLSGTGTAGATLRVYIERYEPDGRRARPGDAGGAGRPDRGRRDAGQHPRHTGRASRASSPDGSPPTTGSSQTAAGPRASEPSTTARGARFAANGLARPSGFGSRSVRRLSG